jgi:hypothetical protein
VVKAKPMLAAMISGVMGMEVKQAGFAHQAQPGAARPERAACPDFSSGVPGPDH